MIRLFTKKMIEIDSSALLSKNIFRNKIVQWNHVHMHACPDRLFGIGSCKGDKSESMVNVLQSFPVTLSNSTGYEGMRMKEAQRIK